MQTISFSRDLVPGEQIANELGISERTLLRWAQSRKGPPRIKVGRSVFYRRSSVEAWLATLEQSDSATGCSR